MISLELSRQSGRWVPGRINGVLPFPGWYGKGSGLNGRGRAMMHPDGPSATFKHPQRIAGRSGSQDRQSRAPARARSTTDPRLSSSEATWNSFLEARSRK